MSVQSFPKASAFSRSGVVNNAFQFQKGFLLSKSDDKGKKRGLSYYHNPGSEQSKNFTVGQLLDRAAEKAPNKAAIISHHENKTLTFLEVKNQAEQLGAGLLKLGMKPGDRLAIMGVNSVHWYVTLLAAAKAGIVLVMINPAYRAQELSYSLKKVKAKGLVTDHKFKTQDYLAILTEIDPNISSAPHGQPFLSSELPDLSYVIMATEEKLPGVYRQEDIMHLADGKETIQANEKRIEPDDPLCIMFSSGTTGIPKASVISHFGVVNTGWNFGERLSIVEMKPVVCLQVPFFHIFGTVPGIVTGLVFMTTTVLPGATFSKESTLEVLQRYKITFICGTPTMYLDLCNILKKSLPTSFALQDACRNLEIIGCGGSYISPDLVKTICEVFSKADFIGGLGMTELSGVCFSMHKNESTEDRENTIGYLSDNTEVKIVDREGKMVPFGVPGEAWYRSTRSLLEYWGDEKIEAKTKAGWYKSGDVLVLREDGYAYIKGRVKDIIIRGGENIFSLELENFLDQHPEILKAEVFGVSDERMGEEVAACIKIKPSSTLTEASLKEYCKGKIAHFKIPRYIRFVDGFPLTTTGKVKKYVLTEVLEKELREQK